MIIIPALDILDGAVVRLRQGEYNTAHSYDISASDAARKIEDAGLTRLHIVDLSAARSGTQEVLSIVRSITNTTKLDVDVGGGIRSVQNARTLIEAGARYVCLGSIAVHSPSIVDEIAASIGIDRVCIALDARDGIIHTHGWQHRAAVRLEDAVSHHIRRGYQHLMVTDISRDGMMTGPNVALYRQLRTTHPTISLIASGGIRSLDDCYELCNAGCAGAIIGKSWLDGTISLQQAAEFVCS